MSVAQELERLQQLRNQGAISESEFEQAKAKAISGGGVGFDIPSASANQLAMFLHFSQYLGFAIPILGFIAPILIWQLKKDVAPEVDIHGRIVANWMLSALIYSLLAGLLTIVFIGFIGLLVLAGLSLIYPLIGGIKANSGEPWAYPGSIRFF